MSISLDIVACLGHSARLRSLALTALGLVGLPTVALAAPGPYPTPDEDPFYAVPANIESFENGDVLDARSEQAVQLVGLIFADAWQLKYKTIDQHGKPSAFVTTVLLPQTPWTGGGPRPLIGYQVAIDALSTKCAPSYILRHGSGCAAAGENVLLSNAVAETSNIVNAVEQGYAVAVPDWEGPTAEWIGDAGAARGVLDGVRAVMRFVPAGIDPAAPIGLIGYSGGALATDWAMQMQPSYAPELRFVGAALGGIPASLHASINAFGADSVGRGAIPLLMAALQRSYPLWDVGQYLSSAGRSAAAASQDDCLLDALIKNDGIDAATYEASTGTIFDNPDLNTHLFGISPLGYPGVPRSPMLFFHAIHDQFAPLTEMEQLAARFCEEGVTVSMATSPEGDHLSHVTAGFPTALQYLTDLFRGEAASNDCMLRVDASVPDGSDAGTAEPATGSDDLDAGSAELDAEIELHDAATEMTAVGNGRSSGCGCSIEAQNSSKGTLAAAALIATLFLCRRTRLRKRRSAG